MAQLAQRLTLTQMQQQWASQLNPVLSNELLQGQLLQNQALNNGVTVINHKLGRPLVGWFIVGINAAATVYDSQATNQTPALTLVLNSNAAATVNLWVF
jgi:hypothetical protein